MYSKIMAVALVAVLAVGVFITVNDDDNSGRSKVTNETYTVTFDGNGGTPGVQTMTMSPGDTFTWLPQAEENQSIFVGWNTDTTDSGKWILVNSVFEEHSDVTYYAIYTSLNWVNYHLCLGGAVNNPYNIIRYTKYQSFDLLPPTPPEAQVFEGWWVDPDYKLFQVSHLEGKDFPRGVDLYAKWSD